MSIKIESGIPLAGYSSATVFPFNEMKVRDSFMIPAGTESEKALLYRKLMSSSRYFALKQSPKWKFALRTQPEGVRVWRME